MASSRLRIAGGAARGVPITEPRGHRLRPTAGRVREAIFNIIGDEVSGARVLDCYAGTGAMGLEALSRGASEAIFLESHPAACKAILDTLVRTEFRDRAQVLRGKLPAALKAVVPPFDLIFLDPPYDDEFAPELLADLGALLSSGGTVVYEHRSRYNPPERVGGLSLSERREYGDSAIAIYHGEESA